MADSKTTNSSDTPAPVNDGRRWDIGQSIQTAKEGSLVVTAVHYQEDPNAEGKKINFTYTVQHQDDVKQQQQAAAEQQQAANPEEPEVR